MKIFHIIGGFAKHLILDIKEYILIFLDYLLNEFKKMRMGDKILIIGSFSAFIISAFPIISYRIFGEIHSLRHPYSYMAPFGFLLILVSSWLEYSPRIVLKLIGYLPFFIILLTSVFSSFIVPDTIVEFNYTIGFWMELVSSTILTVGLIISLAD